MAENKKKLIKGCLAGKQSTYKKLYDTYAAIMLSIARRYARNLEDAEDILQESFTRVFDNLHQLKKADALEGWIKRIVVNTALAHYRNVPSLYNITGIEDAENEISEECDAISTISTEDLFKIISNLPPGCRTVFNLFAIEGFQHKEIGEMLGISTGTSKSQLSDARKLLKQSIRKNMIVATKKQA